MRCPKCGYNSFDYLSECGKCHADLSKTRQELGFSSVEPTMPAWLGSLLKEPLDSKVQDSGHGQATDLDDLLQSNLGAVDEHPLLTLEDDSRPVGTAGEPIELQLDDHDINFLAEADSKTDLGPPLAGPPTLAKATPIKEEADLASQAAVTTTIDLSDDLDDWSLLDLQMDNGVELETIELQDGGDAAGKRQAKAPEVKPSKAARDETIIELSEEDLEGLLLELENGGKGDDKV